MYFITTFTQYTMDSRGSPDFGDTRTVGYYSSREQAFNVVLNNQCDLWETIYTYVVVEYIEPGLYPIAVDRWFFKWNMDTMRYVPTGGLPTHFGNYAFG
jgi:hypothetical protein